MLNMNQIKCYVQYQLESYFGLFNRILWLNFQSHLKPKILDLYMYTCRYVDTLSAKI